VSLLLHISDLHLGDLEGEDDVGDYSKTEIVRPEDRNTRKRLLKSTLKALAKLLTQTDESLSAVIVTGDITTKARPSGFAELPGLLASLDNKLPPPERIVVVPGNHDVRWGEDSGSAARYQGFVAGVRSLGYVTPLLDGVDYVGDDPNPSANPLLVGDDFVVVAINSADMCGVIEPLPDNLAGELTRLETDGHLQSDVAEQFRRLRMYDVPRIQPRQMDALAERVATVESDGKSRVRIAALHHQLFPIREEEEVKPFESIVNLGALLGFLSDTSTDVVLHGHKHADQIQLLPLLNGDTSHEAIVCACGTIGGAIGTGHEIAKLIRVGSSLPRLRTIDVLSVPAVSSGRSLRDHVKKVHSARTSLQRAGTQITVVSGLTSTDVHEQLLAFAASEERPNRDLVCVVEDGASALSPPSTYIWPDGHGIPLDRWFPETVDWWQDPSPGTGKPFTHGQRLRSWSAPGESPIDQIQEIVDLLDADYGSSRGVAVLVDPATDELANKEVDFPSFSLLHVWIDRDKLQCSAFFRKQEMTYWWAINAAEIASVQRDIIGRLRPNHSELAAGAIRTQASESVFSDHVPKVNVPRIDRMFWKDADGLRALAMSVADAGSRSRESDLAALSELLGEWAPDAEDPPADGSPVPGPGLAAILGTLTSLRGRYPDSPVLEAADLLRDIQTANDSYRANQDNPDPRSVYRDWRSRVRPKLVKLQQLLSSISNS
jgi:3',5'-cyclic AMP phosphodiesterase CpdA